MSTNIYNATTDKLKDIGSGGGGDPEALEAIENTITPSSTKEEEGAITATKTHSEGDYFNLGGVFVKALDDISVGDTLEEGVNYEITNVGAELESINSGLAEKASVSDVNGVQTALTVIDPDEGSGVITFGVDANGNYGYKKVGADSVTPFKSGSTISDFDYEVRTGSVTPSSTQSPNISSRVTIIKTSGKYTLSLPSDIVLNKNKTIIFNMLTSGGSTLIVKLQNQDKTQKIEVPLIAVNSYYGHFVETFGTTLEEDIVCNSIEIDNNGFVDIKLLVSQKWSVPLYMIII